MGLKVLVPNWMLIVTLNYIIAICYVKIYYSDVSDFGRMMTYNFGNGFSDVYDWLIYHRKLYHICITLNVILVDPNYIWYQNGSIVLVPSVLPTILIYNFIPLPKSDRNDLITWYFGSIACWLCCFKCRVWQIYKML